MTNRQLFSSTPSVKHLILRGCFILFLSFCGLQTQAQNPTLTTSNITICGGSVDLNSLITTNGTTVTWSEKPQATAISAGGRHSLAILSDGTVKAWGFNGFGQTDVPTFSATPTAIAGGGLHSLALLSNNTIVGWGDNFYGQATSPFLGTNVPTAIAAGGQHSIALLSSGYMRGWGRNDHGQATGVALAPLSIAIATGESHSLALFNNGTVVGWGLDFFPQNTPYFFAPPIAIAAGDGYNLALLGLNGIIIQWDNLTGQTTNHLYSGIPKAIAAGGAHSLALLSDGNVVGWGDNSSGQTTIPTFATTSTAISAGSAHSLALLKNGSVVGWGNNSSGQADNYDALPLSNSTVSPTSTKTYYVVVRNANGAKSTGSVTVTVSLSLPPITTNNALTFDGVNDFVITNDCGSTPIINGGNALTVSYWFKGSSLQSAVRNQNGANFIIAGWNGKHVLSNDGGTTGGISVGANATDGAWHHVAFTWQQGVTNGFKSYLDGNLVSQRDAANVPLPVINALFYLGAFNGTSEFMNGSLDEVCVWNIVRTQAQIKASMLNCPQTAPQSGLLIYYKFDHGTANGVNSDVFSLMNSASNANSSGVPFNFGMTNTSSNLTTGYSLTAPATTTNNALNFDGTNDNVQINKCSGSLFAGGDALTIEYWFKGSSNQSAVRMQENSNFIVAGWNGFHILSNDGGTSGIWVGSGYTDGNWHHIAMTWQRGGLFTSYLDGVQVAQKAASNTPLPAFSAGVYLGSLGGTSEFMNGSLDDVRVWTVARTQAQIQANMSACTLLDQTGLLMYYQFDHGTANGANATINTLRNTVNASELTGTLNGFDLSTNSNWVTGKSCGAVLPIELLDFKGTPQYNGNFLTWETANEENNKGFNIERASAPQPPQGAFAAWDVLGFVNAKGKSALYEFLDVAPPSGAGEAYYRLRQIDNDSKETLSKVISIATKSKTTLKAYPSVTSHFLTIETTEVGDYQIINLLGQQVLNGKTGQRVDVSALPQATYIVKVGLEQAKFVKQ